MPIKFSDRVGKIEELIFTKLNAFRNGDPDLVDLSRGLPLGLPPREILEELNMRNKDPQNHIYTDPKGLKYFRDEIAYFYKDRFNVELDPENEIQIMIGSKEGLGQLVLALCNTDDRVIYPDPAFPVYKNAILLGDAVPVPLKLKWDDGYVPTDKQLSSCLDGKGREKLMFINYPHNPTGACCTLDDFQRMVNFARKNNIVICYDSVYRELAFSKHATLLQVPGAKDVCVEIGSMSKTFHMVGWRVAYMIGNKDVIEKIRAVKSVFDVGPFVPIQYAAAMGLKMASYIDGVPVQYKNKCEMALKKLNEYGYEVFTPQGAFFIWIKLPKKFKTSMDFITHVYKTKKLLLIPGLGLGENGEGFFRISLTAPKEQIEKGLQRLGSVSNWE